MFHLNTSYGAGKRKFVQMVQVKWPRWQPCPFMVKTFLKSSSQEPEGRLYLDMVCILEM